MERPPEGPRSASESPDADTGSGTVLQLRRCSIFGSGTVCSRFHRYAMNVCLKARDPQANRQTLRLVVVQFFKLHHYPIFTHLTPCLKLS
jgi:hypothetical protein